MSNPSFDSAASAYAQVRSTIASMKVQYKQVCDELLEVQVAIDTAQTLRVPLGDLKAAILDFVDACGHRYARDQVAMAIANFATNNIVGRGDSKLIGKPMRFCDIERAVNGGDHDYATQLATPSKHMFDDRALYFLFSPLLKEQLSVLMNEMSPKDFGYANIHLDKVGSDRATRRTEIAALRAKQDALNKSRADLEQKLVALGVSLSEVRNISPSIGNPLSLSTSSR